MAKSTTAQPTASVLAFDRKLEVSDAVFSQYNSEDKHDGQQNSVVKVREKSVRGTISNRLKNKDAADPTKLDAKIQNPNLQTVDVAMLDSSNDMLKVNFTLKVLPFDGTPSACNNLDYQEKLTHAVREYMKKPGTDGIDELAKRYAVNLINGRWLWRNRIGSKEIAITVRGHINDETSVVTIDNAKKLNLRGFDEVSKEVNTVADWIRAGLRDEAFVMMEIEARAKVGFGQEVYPSQELVLDTGKTKSKELYVINKETKQAGMHSQKISNAIRTIDTWYTYKDQDETGENRIPIAVEPYGSVTTLGQAFRQPKDKMDFYTLFDKWVSKGEAPEAEQQHFVMAVLVRGGVFGESSK